MSEAAELQCVRLSRKWFNPLYFHIRKYVDDPKVRKILIYGSKSSGKTMSICQLLAVLTQTQKASTIIYRKEGTTIRTTVKPSMEKAIESIRFTEAYEVMDMLIRSQNEKEIVFKGLDKEEKIKGIEGFRYLYMDELDHFSYAEWLQANASLRGMPNQKIFASWNPVSIQSWIKTDVVDNQVWHDLPLDVDGRPETMLTEGNSYVRRNEDGSTILIWTNYQDNKWMVGGDGYGYVDENLIREYESRKYDENWYRVNVLGEWGLPDAEHAWAFTFEDSHISDTITIDKRKPVVLSFDFNINPMTVTAHQYEFLRYYHTLYEFRIENTGTEGVCKAIKASEIGDCFFIVTGDATGMSRSAMSGNINNYTIIRNTLNLAAGQIKVPTNNPPHSESRALTNAIFARHPDRKVHKRCKYLIDDLRYVQGKDNDSPNPPDKMMGHLLDGVRYCDNTFFYNFIAKIR